MLVTLNAECRLVLLEIHEILMTWNTDEGQVLQAVCEKLAVSRSYQLILGALPDTEGALRITGVAGNGVSRGIGMLLGSISECGSNPLEKCLHSGLPIGMEHGLSVLGNVEFLRDMPPHLLQQPIILYPLLLQGKGIGLIGVISEYGEAPAEDDHSLLQMVAQHTGFALGMLREFVIKEKATADLRLAAAVFDNSLEGIFITDVHGTIQATNTAVSRVTGYAKDELLGKNPRILQSGRHGRDFYAALWNSIKHTGQWQGEIWNRRKNGEIYPEWLSISAIRNETGETQHYIGIFIDISLQKKAELRLDYMAHHDQLTDLPNRALFHDRLQVAILQAKRNRQPVAVLFIDLDHFKHINDTFGHAIGDELLRAMAKRIAGCLRAVDTLARIGGDEFTILLQHFSYQSEVGLVADKIISAIQEPFSLGEHTLYITASIGVSLYPEDGEDPDVLMKNSDTAMYLVKNAGRNGMQFFRERQRGIP